MLTHKTTEEWMTTDLPADSSYNSYDATHRNLIVLVICIALFAGFAASMGIFYEDGNGQYEFTSIHGMGAYDKCCNDSHTVDGNCSNSFT